MAYSFSTNLRKELNLFTTIPNSHIGTKRLVFLDTFSSFHTLSYCCSSSSSSWSSSHSVSFKLKVQKHYGKLKRSLGFQSDIQSMNSMKENGPNMEWKSSVGKILRKPFWRNSLFGSKKVQSIVLLNVITVVYASDILVIKEAEAMMDPAAFSTVRFVMSAIPFLPFAFRARNDIQTRNSGIELGCWLSLAYFIEAIALLTSEAGRASFISLFTVIAVPLLDGMLGAIIPSRTWFGVLMSAIGVAVLECSGSPPNIGDLLNFLSAIFFGIHMLRTEHISRSTEKENFLALLGYETAVIAVLSTLWLLLGGCFDCQQEFSQSAWDWTEFLDWIVSFPWIPALYTGVFSTGVCSLIEFSAMRDVSATETAIIYGLEPVWGAGFAWFLLGERWGTIGWIGATFILGGSLLVQTFGSPSPTKKSEEAEEFNQNRDLMVPRHPNIKNGLSATPIVIRTRKTIFDILK